MAMMENSGHSIMGTHTTSLKHKHYKIYQISTFLCLAFCGICWQVNEKGNVLAIRKWANRKNLRFYFKNVFVKCLLNPNAFINFQN